MEHSNRKKGGVPRHLHIGVTLQAHWHGWSRPQFGGHCGDYGAPANRQGAASGFNPARTKAVWRERHALEQTESQDLSWEHQKEKSDMKDKHLLHNFHPFSISSRPAAKKAIKQATDVVRDIRISTEDSTHMIWAILPQFQNTNGYFGCLPRWYSLFPVSCGRFEEHY
jgi:hypothetical protein